MSEKRAQVSELLRTTGLVVLDPDDSEQIKRFADLHDPAWEVVRAAHPDRVGTPTWEIYAQMLRYMLDPTPPKPPEPQGLGAVVEDADGRQFVRIQTHYTCPWLQRGVAGVLWKWENVAAVKVLSEGVPA